MKIFNDFTRDRHDLKQKERAMKRIKLQLQKKLFEAKTSGDLAEVRLLEEILIPRLEQRKK